MDKDQRKAIVRELIALMQKGNAHVTFNDAVANVPADQRGQVPGDLPYSIWQLVEHMRITQRDILDFSVSEDYQELDWPKDYWTAPKEIVRDEEWNSSLKTIQADQEAFIALLKDENRDLLAPFPWGSGQNLLREAMLIGDHNAYHTAEIVVIRRLLGSWKPAH